MGNTIKCPKCGEIIDVAEIAEKTHAEFSARGGQKSRRTLTPEQARAMVQARVKKKKPQ
jgi:hypothetical protein